MRAAVFLARDGAILTEHQVAGEGPIVTAKGAASAVASICGLGYRVVMYAPESSDGGRFDAEIGRHIEEASNGARIDQVCRYPGKTASGRKRRVRAADALSASIEQLGADLNIDMDRSWLIGVDDEQIEAGVSQGLRTILLDPVSEGVVPPAAAGVMPAYRSGNLVEAVRIVAQQRKPDVHEEIHKAELGGRRWDVAAVARIQRSREEEGLEETPRRRVREEPVIEPSKPKAQPKPEPKQEQQHEEPAVVGVLPAVKKPAEAEVSRSVPREAPAAGEKGTQRASNEARLLKQILSELRSQRSAGSGMAPLHMVAMILQLVALICLIGGLWMASDNVELFMRWAWSGVMVQLAAVTVLLMHDRSS
ncbi:hypothetical protein [Mucisphaera calidilacus]|uniref:Uncharacterized protein n=1 Tax=Mucisphaera calidilacus TaxID=2527982 RepID=A0A518BXP0_9BACT|nr:hypothetical protein [Mucisphaera calidilacus]QDU71743.1 hypothetical protein Pan265_15960 [Mucisphaera calidilacus]